MRTLQAQTAYEESVVDVYEASGAAESLGGLRFLEPRESAVGSWRYQYVKRILDIVCALAMASLFAIPGLIIAVAILLTSRGPIFYREVRIGRGGTPFRIWKFRSMCQDAAKRFSIESAEVGGAAIHWRMRKLLSDPRITPIGGFLRRWSLDEIPQLINVLRGEMSLIGPRPIVKSETAFYGNLLHYYLEAVPGLSGLWQVSGRSHIGYAERAQLDASYVRNWSLLADFSILWRTIPAVLCKVGAR